MDDDFSCLIVGAGLAGLAAAGLLTTHGWKVVLLDKGRAVGGRMATRRIGESRFDYGAQFFTARDARFTRVVTEWERAGRVAPWFTEGGHVRYMAIGGMSALPKYLAERLDVRTGAEVTTVSAESRRWSVVTAAGQHFSARALLLTAPAPQSSDLLGQLYSEGLERVEFDPCLALLATLEGSGRVPAPGYVRPDAGPIEWLADNTRKGVSQGCGALTLHARAHFSRRYFDSPPEEVARLLLEAAEPWTEGKVTAWRLHRWRYSKPSGLNNPLYSFPVNAPPVVTAGDAFAGGRVEGAFLSGLEAAEALLAGCPEL